MYVCMYVCMYVVVVATQSGGGAYGPVPVGGKRSRSICSSSAHCAQLDCLPRYGVLGALKVRSGPGMTIWEIVLTYDRQVPFVRRTDAR